MSTSVTDAELVARTRRGDKEAFGDLYERYQDALFRYVYYRVGNQRDAEDLTEEVFLKVWESIGRFRGDAAFRSWVYRIAHNMVIDHYRTRKDSVALSQGGVVAEEQAGVERQLLAKERATLLAKAISSLSPLHQQVLILRFIDGFSTEEVAEILERETGTIRVLQHRALKAASAYLIAQEVADQQPS